VLAFVALLGATPEIRADDGIATARRAAETYAAATRGIVVFDVTTRTLIRGAARSNGNHAYGSCGSIRSGSDRPWGRRRSS